MINKGYEYLSKRRLRRDIINKKADLNSLQEVDLSYMNLSSIDIRGAKLNNSVLERAKFKNTILQGAVLKEAKLLGANLQGANLIYVDFTEADLRGVNMRNVNLYNANLTCADLRGADLTDAKIDYSTNFMDANMKNIIVDEVKLNKAIISGAKIKHLGGYDKMWYMMGFRQQFWRDKARNSKKVFPI